MGTGPETSDARFMASPHAVSPTRQRQFQQQRQGYMRGTKTRKGFSADLVKHGMFRDTTITAATRRREIAVVREHVEQKRLTEAQLRLEREMERDQHDLEMNLKRKARKAKREQRRQGMVRRVRAADLIQYHWLNYLQRRERALQLEYDAAATSIQSVARRKSAQRQCSARRWIRSKCPHVALGVLSPCCDAIRTFVCCT
jgi:hypothetical protein